MFSGWMKGAFNGGKKEIQEQLQQKLNFILSTAPMWDRLELKGKYFLGEFLDFKGKQEDIQALRNIKRSKVNRLIVQKTSMFGLDVEIGSKIKQEDWLLELRGDYCYKAISAIPYN
uniref:Uncharacterized protein n=1 Tax=Daucus carota subsp. sativus TaxID=79200 RepID=A0A164WT77_DAUCS